MVIFEVDTQDFHRAFPDSIELADVTASIYKTILGVYRDCFNQRSEEYTILQEVMLDTELYFKVLRGLAVDPEEDDPLVMLNAVVDPVTLQVNQLSLKNEEPYWTHSIYGLDRYNIMQIHSSKMITLIKRFVEEAVRTLSHRIRPQGDVLWTLRRCYHKISQSLNQVYPVTVSLFPSHFDSDPSLTDILFDLAILRS